MNKRLHFFLTLPVIFYSCAEIRTYKSIPMSWKNITSEFVDLPTGIHVFSGRNFQIPINAWYVEVDNKQLQLHTEIVVANDNDMRETLSEIAERINAHIVINGGYFLMQKHLTEHVGLLMDNNKMISRPLHFLLKRKKRYMVTRGAIGFHNNGNMDIAWIAGRNDSLFQWSKPAPNAPEVPISVLDFKQAAFWDVKDGFQAGPILIQNSKKYVTDEEEAFFWTKIPEVHPRSATGYTKKGKYIFLVVDGRQPDSRGVDLNELAILMDDLNCVEAINFDGGGYSALVVSGRLLNKPVEFNTQRKIMSAIAVISD